MPHSVALGRSVPKELKEELLKKLAYVSSSLERVTLSQPDANEIIFELKSGEGVAAEEIAKNIADVAAKLCQNYRPVSSKVLASAPVSGGYTGDPHPELEATGELFFFGSGRYGFGPRLLELIQLFDRHVMAIAQRWRAPDHQFPSIIGADVLDTCKYLRSFPTSLNLVSHLREDLQASREFAAQVAWKQDHLHYPSSSMSGVKCLLSPSVCFHYYAWLRDRQVATPQTITALGKCFRYESSNMTGLERLWDFTMRELIFLGPQAYIFQQRQAMLDETVELLRTWGIGYEIRSATDPFFLEEYAAMAAYQMSFDLKFEILAPLPYKANKELAIGSLNYHQDLFGRSFGISLEDKSTAHTGCVGYGLERVALAFLAQHGLNPSHWPDAVRAGLREL